MITICDTGPLLAYLNRNDSYHEWSVAQCELRCSSAKLYSLKLFTFLREVGLTVDPLFQLLEREAIRLAFDLSAHWSRIRSLMSRYRQMDLADASVVVMTELHARSRVLTIVRTSVCIVEMIVR